MFSDVVFLANTLCEFTKKKPRWGQELQVAWNIFKKIVKFSIKHKSKVMKKMWNKKSWMHKLNINTNIDLQLLQAKNEIYNPDIWDSPRLNILYSVSYCNEDKKRLLLPKYIFHKLPTNWFIVDKFSSPIKNLFPRLWKCMLYFLTNCIHFRLSFVQLIIGLPALYVFKTIRNLNGIIQ